MPAKRKTKADQIADEAEASETSGSIDELIPTEPVMELAQPATPATGVEPEAPPEPTAVEETIQPPPDSPSIVDSISIVDSTVDSTPAGGEPVLVEAEPPSPTEPSAEQVDGFAALGLSPQLLRAVREQGFEEPTPIQRRTIPLLREGKDVIAQAQTGTGKTAAFALPLLQGLDPADRGVQGLVLAPTRELAVQVAGSIYALGRHTGVQVLPVYGGQPIERQLRALRAGVQIVIGTPGRILDHLRRGSLQIGGVRTLILDEADEMLDMGFEEEIEAIIAEVPENRQTALFSATIPPRITALARRYLKDAVRVVIEAERLTVPQVHQTYYAVAPRAKLDALTRILDMEAPGAGIIFCRTKRDVDEIGDALLSRGYPAETLHGDLSQAMRDRVMHRFREGQAELLVATDVAARGLDIEHVSHVINFDIPEDPEQYVHRIGRTARAGRSGDAITLVAPREMRLLHEIERLIRKKIQPARVPSVGDIAARRLELTKEAISQAISEGGLEPYLLAVEDLATDRDLTQVAAAALRLVLERDGTGPRTTVSPLNGEAALGVETGMQRLFIDLGRKQGIRPGDIVGAITNEAGITGSDVGAIDIYDNFTFVDVAQGLVRQVIEALQGATLHGKGFKVDIARPREETADEAEPAAHAARGRRQRPGASAESPQTADEDEDERPTSNAPERPTKAQAGFASDEDEDEDDEDLPQRPAGWRDGVPPRSTSPYPGSGQRGMPSRRGGPQGGGRQGFGPFRGPESRESPPWQRRGGQGDRPPYRPRSGETDQAHAPFRSRRPEGGGFAGRREPEQPYRAPRPEGQGNYRGPRENEARRPRRREGPPGDAGRRPSQGPPPRQGRRRDGE